MNRRVALRLALVVGVAAAWGCNSTHIGNPPEAPGEPTAAALHFRSSSLMSASSAPAQGEDADAAIWVVIRDIQLFPMKGDDSAGDDAEGAVTLAGPFVAELVTGQLLGGDALLEGMQGDYRMIRFKLRAADDGELPTGAPAELEGRNLYMTGQRRDGAPFEVLNDHPIELRLEAGDAPITLGDEVSSLIVGFDTSSWLLPSELVELEAPITISDTDNASLLRELRSRLKSSTLLYPDGDLNGELSSEERLMPLAAPNDDDSSDD